MGRRCGWRAAGWLTERRRYQTTQGRGQQPCGGLGPLSSARFVSKYRRNVERILFRLQAFANVGLRELNSYLLEVLCRLLR